MYTIKINKKPINKVSELIREEIQGFNALDEKRAELRGINAVGSISPNAYNEEVAKLDTAKAALIAATKADVAKAKEEFFKDLDNTLSINGADLVGDNEADYVLFRDNLINTPEDLDRIMEKHIDSPAFRVAATNYAERKGWQGMEYLTAEDRIREFAEEFFKRADMAADAPTGSYWGMFVTSDDAIREQVRAYNLVYEYCD